jgi:hypothetical protein
MTHYVEPDAPLVQATADLLAARVALYKVQPGSRLVNLADEALTMLLTPRVEIESVACAQTGSRACAFPSRGGVV